MPRAGQWVAVVSASPSRWGASLRTPPRTSRSPRRHRSRHGRADPDFYACVGVDAGDRADTSAATQRGPHDRSANTLDATGCERGCAPPRGVVRSGPAHGPLPPRMRPLVPPGVVSVSRSSSLMQPPGVRRRCAGLPRSTTAFTIQRNSGSEAQATVRRRTDTRPGTPTLSPIRAQYSCSRT